MNIIKQFEPFFGDWYADGLIGTGNYGRVYRIHRTEFGETFYAAMKYISIPQSQEEIDAVRSELHDNSSINNYFATVAREITSESRLMSRLKGYTNIVSYEDSKVIPKRSGIGYDVFIRMELLESLSSVVSRGPLGRSEVIKLGADICTALVLCAERGLIHRDIKPDNIFRNDHGDYKLGDFGVARQLERTTAFMSKKGTYNYMAPEVYLNREYGTSCDLYSLGMVLYRLLNKERLPFLPPAPAQLGVSDYERALSVRMSGYPLPAPCGADPALAAVVLKACAFRPEDRFVSAAEMRAALLACLAQGASAPAGAAAAPLREPEKPAEKKRGKAPVILVAAAAGLVLLAAVVGLFVYVFSHKDKGDRSAGGKDPFVITTEDSNEPPVTAPPESAPSAAPAPSSEEAPSSSPTPSPSPSPSPTPAPTEPLADQAYVTRGVFYIRSSEGLYLTFGERRVNSKNMVGYSLMLTSNRSMALEFEPVFVSGRTCRLIVRNFGDNVFYLDRYTSKHSDSPVDIWEKGNDTDQFWMVERQPDGSYCLILSSDPTRYLTEQLSYDGQPLSVQGRQYTSAQRWYLEFN